MTTKNLVYKVARFNKDVSGRTLQDLFVAALKKRKNPLSRQQETDSENQFRLVNYHGPHMGMRVGELFDYTRGQSQPIAKLDENAEELEILSLKPAKGQDFLHGIMYFGIFNNSLILSQSMSIRSKQFEDYINWLLVETGQLGEGEYVNLNDQPPLSARKKIVNTKSIEFHAPITFEAINQKSNDKKVVFFKPSNVGLDWLNKILPPEITLPPELNASEILNNGQLDVKLMVSWVRQNKEDSTELLDRISNQLRHVDNELDFTIHTKSGKIDKNEIKLKKPVSVGLNDKGLVKRSDMWDRMHEWITTLIAEEKVIPKA